MPTELVLASASPRRAELLRGAGVDFRVHAIESDESWHAGENPVSYAQRIATQKATLAAAAIPDALILAADTTVWLRKGDPPLGKPADRDAAWAMLRALTLGNPHRVTTACAFISPGREVELLTETTEVWMRRFDADGFERFIGPYLDANEWTDKAGGYAIQGLAAGLVDRIAGSYTTIVGLPLAQVLARLEVLGR